MGIFPLPLFPEGGLASSVITTVWVGVFVLCFFNLRFGWVLSGLVVPGYLVPLLIVKPAAALVISVEAVITYILVWLFSEKLSRGRYPSLFGRDRFMGLILASIAVRLSMDGYILPEFADWLEQNFDRRFDWQDNLQSFGLVIISLMANQFWKPGLGRGLVAAVVTIGLTWFIVRYGLMEFTNFRMSGVSYLYEGLASSILASPKAYIILTLTAMIASHMNVKYGWDFSGILIPALIALQWYQPTKIVTSFAEAIVIYSAAQLILKLPFMANVTLEGGRKLLLFFNISFVWKLILGWFIVWQGIEVKTTDFYGFGYLLSTLIAIKAHDKDIFPRLARSTLQVSLAGAVLGNIVGFSLSAAVTRSFPALFEQDRDVAILQSNQLGSHVAAAVGDAHIRRIRAQSRPLSTTGERMLGDIVELFEAGIPPTSPLFDISADDWRVRKLANGLIAVAREDRQGRELLLFNPDAKRDLAIILPDPTAVAGLAGAALELQRNQDAKWLVISAPRPATAIGESGVEDIFRRASGMSFLTLNAAGRMEQSLVHLANRSGVAADLSLLRMAIPGLQVGLEVAGDPLNANEAAVFVTQDGISALARFASPEGDSQGLGPCRLPRAANPAPGRRRLVDRAYLRFEIAAPLISGLESEERPNIARAAARLAGFEIDRCLLGNREHWNLYSPSRDEGYYLFAKPASSQRAVLAYRIGADILPARIAANIHTNWNSDALLIAPERDDFFRSPRTSYDVIWQEWLRSQPQDRAAPASFQLRPDPGTNVSPANVDLLVASERIGPADEGRDLLISAIRQAGLRPQEVSTEREFAGFEARPSMTSRYLSQSRPTDLAVGWLLVNGRGAQE